MNIGLLADCLLAHPVDDSANGYPQRVIHSSAGRIVLG
jgi:hypothetical protein